MLSVTAHRSAQKEEERKRLEEDFRRKAAAELQKRQEAAELEKKKAAPCDSAHCAALLLRPRALVVAPLYNMVPQSHPYELYGSDSFFQFIRNYPREMNIGLLIYS